MRAAGTSKGAGSQSKCLRSNKGLTDLSVIYMFFADVLGESLRLLEEGMVIDVIVAAGMAVPAIICALATYRRASAALIWARRRDPASPGGIERDAV